MMAFRGKAAAFGALSLLAVCALVVVQHLGAGQVALEVNEDQPGELALAMDKYQVGQPSLLPVAWAGGGAVVGRRRAARCIACHTPGMQAPAGRARMSTVRSLRQTKLGTNTHGMCRAN